LYIKDTTVNDNKTINICLIKFVIMYYYFSLDSNPTKLEDKQAISLMNNISSQWEDEDTPFGVLKLAVFNWSFTTNGSSTIVSVGR